LGNLFLFLNTIVIIIAIINTATQDTAIPTIPPAFNPFFFLDIGPELKVPIFESKSILLFVLSA